MKISSLALVAWMLVGQIALADDTANAVSNPPGSHISPVAQNAAEAPRWNQTPAAGATAPTAPAAPAVSTPVVAPSTVPSVAPSGAAGLPSNVSGPSSIQATSAQAAAPQPVAGHPTVAQPPQQLPVSDDAKPLAPSTAENSNSQPENSDAAADQPRPLYSVMVRRDPKTTTPKPAAPSSEVEPARYEETLPSPPARTNASQNSSSSAPTTSGASETPLDPEKIAAARATADLLATSFQPRVDHVSPITLLESINQAGESGRASAIQDYWRLWRAWADCNWAQDEEDKLEQVVPSRSSVDSPMLSTARAAAAARVSEARVRIQGAQDALMRSAHLAIQQNSYRPADPPLVGPYHTYFKQLFADRQPPGHTWQIDRSLPMRLRAINHRTAAVISAANAIHYAEEAHAKGESDMRTVLSCHEELYHQRRALLDEVLAYNLDIGDYVSTVVSPSTPNDKLVAMLIETKSADQMQAVPTATTSVSGSGSPSRSSSTVGVRANDGWVPSTMRSVEPTRAKR